MAPQTHSPFAALSRVLEELDADGRSVNRTEASTEEAAAGSLCATVEVGVPLPVSEDVGFAPQSATLTEDGLSLTYRRPTFVETIADRSPDGLSVDVSQTGAAIEGDDLLVTLDIVIGETAAAQQAAAAEQPSDTNPEREATASSQVDSGEAASLDEPTSHSRAVESSDPIGSPSADSVSAAGQSSSAASSSLSSITAAESSPGATDGSETAVSSLAASGPGRQDSADATGSDSSLEDVRDESVPPYEDTAYLRRLYETCETFAEMSDRIVMDVSAETVRRYTIEAGVHTPTSYETDESDRSSDGDVTDGAAPDVQASESDEGLADTTTGASTAGTDPDESMTEAVSDESTPEPDSSETPPEPDPSETPPEPDPSETTPEPDPEESTPGSAQGSDPLPDEQLLADGIGLPESLTLRDVADAVVDARTVYEVQRQLGLSGTRTRHLLQQLNILDLVLRRVSDDPERQVSYDTVAARIRQCAPDSA
ncbi:hypothetical protein [Halobellus ordinarius]|uniref:hypothetical protein n=1 Tax=Halobellus ordinarius TaxID=3075120 RepID=UPI0028801AF3|nr:hypothetical protein [Halobellus sp. ZY16]